MLRNNTSTPAQHTRQLIALGVLGIEPIERDGPIGEADDEALTIPEQVWVDNRGPMLERELLWATTGSASASELCLGVPAIWRNHVQT